jgi:hypothetical protein
MLRPTVSRLVCLGVRPNLGTKTTVLLLSDSCGFVDVGHPLCRLQLQLAIASAVILRSQCRETHDHILLSPYLIPHEQGGQLYSQTLCFIFVASYDSQGYD